MLLAYLAAFGCAVSYGVGSVLQDMGAKSQKATDSLDAKGLMKVATQLPYMIGLGLDGFGFVLSLVALQFLPLFAVQAISAGSIGVTVLLAAVVLKSLPSRNQVGCLVLLGVGLLLLALTAAPDDPRKVSGAFTVGMWISVGVVGAMGVLAPRIARGDRGAALLGAISGLGYGGTAICARAIEADGSLWKALTEPLTYALILFGALGVVLFTSALQRGSVTVATACQYAAEVIVPSIIGLIWLGDRARNGQSVLAAAGFVLTLVAAVVLALVSPAEQGADAVAVAPSTS